MDHVTQPAGSPPVNGYSHVVVARGPFVFVSGQVPLDAAGDLVGEDDVEQQCEQVFRNLETALEAVGSSLDQVARLTFYLTSLDDLPVVREVRDRHVDTEHPPASTLVQVAGLVDPAFRLEVDAVACLEQAV